MPQTLSEKEINELISSFNQLTPAQQNWIKSTILAFSAARKFERANDSDLITDTALYSIGDRLLTHHAASRQALSKDRFEFAFEAALTMAGITAELVPSRTNRGHDITINGVPVSLKTEASATIRDNLIHVSKWMELGRGEWSLPLLLNHFLEHLRSYDRIFTMRRLKEIDSSMRYELVEIPKPLLLEASNCHLEVCTNSKQIPKPGYGYVKDNQGLLKYSLYFDGGSERKLQIKHLRKDLCKVHATWTFSLPPVQ